MKYSIVIPVYNSALILEELNNRLHETLDSIGDTYEIIFVDDASPDNSWEKLLDLKDKFPQTVKLIRFAKNYGQHSATLCGLKFVSGRYVITIDDDLQNIPEDIPLLINEILKKEADLVYGIGIKNHPKWRLAGSYLWKFGARKIDKGLGNGSSFRIFTSEIKEKLIQHQQSIIFIDELLFWYTSNIEYVTVKHFSRKEGKSNYGPLKMFRFILGLSFNYGTTPLKLLTYFGVIASFFSFLLGLFFIVRKIFYNVSVPGFTATIVTILFSTSVILIGIGIIGKYLNNIFILLNNRPTFSIREKKL